MNKKILYGIFFVSIFLLSTASMVQPVHGYECGIPKEGIGITTESEIKIYDEDEWEKHLGKDVDLDLKAEGDADVVGAKSKQIVRDIEYDEEVDHIRKKQLKENAIPGNIDARQNIESLYNPLVTGSGGYPPLVYLANSTIGPTRDYMAFLASIEADPTIKWFKLNITQRLGWTADLFNITYLSFAMNNLRDYDTLIAQYGEKYDGTYMERDLWDYYEDADYPSKPDYDDDGVWIMADPRDWYDSYKRVKMFQGGQMGDTQTLRNIWADQRNAGANLVNSWYASFFNGSLHHNFPLESYLSPSAKNMTYWDIAAYEAFNTSIVVALNESVKAAIGIDKATFDFLAGFPGAYDALVASELRKLVEELGMPVDFLKANLTDSSPTGLGTLAFLGLLANYTHDLVAGVWFLVDGILEYIKTSFEWGYPQDKFGHLWGLLLGGQPTYVPEDDWLARMLKEYDIDDETKYYLYGHEASKDLDGDGEIVSFPYGTKASLPALFGLDVPLGGEAMYLQAYIDVSLEGSVVTVEFEYQDDQIDPDDSTSWPGTFAGEGEDELKDFEYVIEYGETGSESYSVFKDGDEEFWRKEGLAIIPGFEVTVILGASALSILALIYVVMKKRRM